MSRARDLADTISGAGTFTVDAIPALPTSKITSGTFADARLSSSSVTQHVDLSNLNASNLTSGTVPSARMSLGASDIPALDTAKITTGTFADARLSASSVTQHVDLTSLNADNLTSGTVASARLSLGASDIPNLSANKITSDSLSADRIPNLSAAKITSGTMDGGRISGGTFGSVSASNLTNISISSTYGGVSTYGFFVNHHHTNQTGAYSENTTHGGNKLRPSNAKGSTSNNSSYVSGTWRLMGFSSFAGSSNDEYQSSLYIRIS